MYSCKNCGHPVCPNRGKDGDRICGNYIEKRSVKNENNKLRKMQKSDKKRDSK